MKIPGYIKQHIELNNRLLAQADNHSMIVLDWYNKQLEKLNTDDSEILDEEFYEIQSNWRSNGDIDISAIKENLELLENSK